MLRDKMIKILLQQYLHEAADRDVRYSAAIEGKADLTRTCQNRRE
jgi:hypothetical protein